LVKRELLASRLKNRAEGDLNNAVFLEVTGGIGLARRVRRLEGAK
jgi:hypothetical protein